MAKSATKKQQKIKNKPSASNKKSKLNTVNADTQAISTCINALSKLKSVSRKNVLNFVRGYYELPMYN